MARVVENNLKISEFTPGVFMDIQILREFADLAYTLNFKKTAERMYIGQSTLSKHIMNLEEEVEVQLFVRTRQGVHLTQCGRDFLPYAKRILNEYDQALTLLKRGKEQLTGRLRIGFLDSAVRDLLTASIRSYQRQYPNMKISLASLQVGELEDAFKNNAVDIALSILFPNSFLPPDTIFKTLYEDGISAVIPKDHPLTTKNLILLDDLLAYPIILPSPRQYPSYAKMIREYIENSEIQENIVCDYSHIETALIMVEAEMAVSILPTNTGKHTTTAVFRKIEDCNPVLRVGAMWKKGNHSVGIPEYIDVLFNEAALTQV